MTTLREVIIRGAPNDFGWRRLTLAIGEDHRGRTPRGEVLAAIWHVTDMHICDAESPARQEYMDRFGDEDSIYAKELGDIGTYRPHEMLTVPVFISMLQAVNSLQRAPVSGAKVNLLLLGGDSTDNAQQNEWSWFKKALQGGPVLAFSGGARASNFVGSKGQSNFDERYWHPDSGNDRPTLVYGYPKIPGLFEALKQPIPSPGVRIPHLWLRGNHDVLLQGSVPVDDSLIALATGDQRIVGLSERGDPRQISGAIPETGPAKYLHDASSPRERVPPDPSRTPVLDEGPVYGVSEVGNLVMVRLDTVNPNGGWNGSLDLPQYEWLIDQLEKNRDRYVVVAAHHPSFTLTNDYAPPGTAPRVLGAELVNLLLEYPNVIAMLAGHIHSHLAVLHETHERDPYDESLPKSGFWEITTASLIDWPQQGRIIEVFREKYQGRSQIAIVSTVVDHAAGISWDLKQLDDVFNLAAISRDLAANDYHIRNEANPRVLRLLSTPEFRNVVWRLPDPLVN